MSSKIWRASAPSNIALIKYMGKLPAQAGLANRPTNTSLSYTLSHLLSLVEIETSSASSDTWEPLKSYDGRKLEALDLNEKGASRFLAHLGKVKAAYGVTQSFVVRSANDFPSDCGLASSASSFAALTRAALSALTELSGRAVIPDREAAEWSRQGSGSSCRSFFAPWSIWNEEGADRVDLGYADLLHQVVVVDDSKKTVSSSEAHARVNSSLQFQGRPERAENRARDLMRALRERDWREAFEISWAEFWDMHSLFESSRPSFGYMTPGSLEVLRWVREMSWDTQGDGPLITMDAGANVHLLYRNEGASRSLMQAVQRQFGAKYVVFSGGGAGSSK